MSFGLRLSKTFAVHTIGVASVLKVYHSVVVERGLLRDGIAAHMGDLAALGTLSFNAAMSRFSQPHVVHALEEVARGNMKYVNSGLLSSIIRSNGGQAGCLALVSYWTVRGSLFALDLPRSRGSQHEDELATIWTFPSIFVPAVTGLMLLSVAVVPMALPVFGITYLVGTTWGRLVGSRLLVTPTLAQHSAGWLELHIGRLYSRHFLLAQAVAFGIAALAYMPMHGLRNEKGVWMGASGGSGSGAWHYSRTFRTESFPRHKCDDAMHNDSPNLRVYVEEFIDKGAAEKASVGKGDGYDSDNNSDGRTGDNCIDNSKDCSDDGVDI
mmetsp:Transcript_19806/g.33311  ORF Transcript_19806/g.33311 Transcript_19806/m.33311 type:complete len:325 (+) Transcript_19806:142-1116(+)